LCIWGVRLVPTMDRVLAAIKAKGKTAAAAGTARRGVVPSLDQLVIAFLARVL